MIHTPSKSRQQIRQKKRLEIKYARQLENSEALAATEIKYLLKQALSEEKLNEIAIKTKFMERNRKLFPLALVSILLMGCFNGTEDVASLGTMCCFLRKWFNICLLPQSLQEQINSKECSDFIKQVTMEIIIYETNKVASKLQNKSKKKSFFLFQRILLQDSTVISLPETVSKIFRGCGGSASKAAVKCDIVFDQSNHMIVRCKCIAGRIPDSSLSADILPLANENDLIIRDMGYFNLSHFINMNKKKVLFISRLKPGINMYLNKNDKMPVNIIEYLESLGINKKKIDIDIYIGKEERVHVRLIGLIVPQEVIKARQAQYIKARKTKPSEDLMTWYGYTFMITNISKEKASLKLILKLYKIRWQIELFFKNMKSQLKVDNFTGENKYRILCLLYTKLALTWITALLLAYVQTIIGKKFVISAVKFTKWLRDIGDWQKTLSNRDFTELIQSFERDQDLLKKQVKKRV
jgi:hypothetical protein